MNVIHNAHRTVTISVAADAARKLTVGQNDCATFSYRWDDNRWRLRMTCDFQNRKQVMDDALPGSAPYAAKLIAKGLPYMVEMDTIDHYVYRDEVDQELTRLLAPYTGGRRHYHHGVAFRRELCILTGQCKSWLFIEDETEPRTVDLDDRTMALLSEQAPFNFLDVTLARPPLAVSVAV